MSTRKESLIDCVKCLFVLGAMFIPDAILRYFTRWLGYYSIFELPPSLFSVLWILLLLSFTLLFPRKIGRIFILVFYSVFAFYAILQYGYYLIFDKFVYVSYAQFAGEGGDYMDFVRDILTPEFFIMLALLVLLGVAVFFLYPGGGASSASRKVRILPFLLALALMIGGQLWIPRMYHEDPQAKFLSSAYEYEQFTNSAFDMEICGLYQYLGRDVYITYLKPKPDNSVYYAQTEAFLNTKPTHLDNDMTGILKGKNLIVVQLESLDDWVLNEESTPVMCRLMEEGINFRNMYTCLYGTGATFSTEFAFHTGLYQSLQGKAASSETNTLFPLTIARMLSKDGYRCLSFHENTSFFYNRGNMHSVFGYDKYICTADYIEDDVLPTVDTTIVSNDVIWDLLTGEEPFCSFVITYGAHVPYNSDDPLVAYALQTHPEYDIDERDQELNAVYAKARITDDMISILLQRLEEDDLLDNTVLVVYEDHYNYGLADHTLVQALSEANGSSVLERTPAFIWYKGCDSIQVDKVCQTVDWLPTLANMFGYDISGLTMGSDIFDEAYPGYAIFPDGSWISGDTRTKNGLAIEGSMPVEDVKAMNELAERFLAANEAILQSDYYRHWMELQKTA